MTPTIITADSLARAARETIRHEAPLETAHLYRDPEASADLLRRADAVADRFSREPRSHLPDETTHALGWRFSRARYAAVHSSRASGEPTRAAGRPRGRAADDSLEPTPLHPGLSLDRDFHAELGAIISTPVEISDLRAVGHSARRHLSQAYRLLERADSTGISRTRRRALLRQAAEECREAYHLHDWLADHGAGLGAADHSRLSRFLEHPAWAEVGSRISSAMSRAGVATG